jgi:hypothetical protein
LQQDIGHIVRAILAELLVHFRVAVCCRSSHDKEVT